MTEREWMDEAAGLLERLSEGLDQLGALSDSTRGEVAALLAQLVDHDAA